MMNTHTLDLFLNYLSRSNAITFVVLAWLSLYFIATFSILFARWFQLSNWSQREHSSLESLMMGAKTVRDDSILRKCTNLSMPSAGLLNVCKNVASTSPFIGLFGTVVSILETFAGLGNAQSASLGVIAPAISEALIVTAAGIFVAIPAYTFHILLKRKGYEVLNLIERQADVLLASASKAEPKDDS
jgi:biopolymer transport protein ExbB/TolQ